MAIELVDSPRQSVEFIKSQIRDYCDRLTTSQWRVWNSPPWDYDNRARAHRNLQREFDGYLDMVLSH